MQFQTIEIKKLVPSDFNYRKTIDKDALEELTGSVRAKGVLQPILVRPLNGKQKGKFEIVAGHRRHQAAEAAGLKEMPAMVKALSDEEALEVQVIENTQREDPNPMDEAVGFKRLLEIGKHTPETLAAKLDRSVGYVLSRVKLAELSKPVQTKIAAGELPLGIARLFTRLRNEGDQKKFLEEVTEDGGVSVRRAARMLDDYIQGLSNAPFDTAACGACPCNSGNQTALFPEIGKGDQCSDKSCFYTKSKKHFTDILKEKEKAGFKVFRKEKDVEKLVGYSGTGKAAQKIVALKKDADYSHEHPKRYKSECAGCTDHHAFYLYERIYYGNEKRLEFGEICLDKKCLDAMQRAGKKEEKTARAMDKQDKALDQMRRNARAANCRDRFLLREIKQRLNGEDTHPHIFQCRRRIALFILLGKYYKNAAALKEFLKGIKVPLGGLENSPIGIHYDIYHYALASLVPAERLHDAIDALIVNSLEDIKGANLLQIAPHAGLDVHASFTIDREFITSQSFKNKGDLIKLAKEIGIAVNEKASKEMIVQEILAQDLTGKIPAEIAETLVLEKAETEEETDEYCDDCGEDGEDCMCEGGPDLSVEEDGNPESRSADPAEAEAPEEESPEPEAEATPEIDPTMPRPTVDKKRGKKARAAKEAEA